MKACFQEISYAMASKNIHYLLMALLRTTALIPLLQNGGEWIDTEFFRESMPNACLI